MANLQKTTKPGFRHKNSCPDGWLHAGAKVPIRLTVRQEELLPPGHRHPPVLLQPGRPHPPVLPPQPAPLAQLAGHQQGLQRLQAGGLPLRDPGSSGGCHRRLPGLRPGRGQLAEPQPPGPGPKNQAPSAFTGTGSFLAAGSVKEIRYDGKRRVKLPCLGSVKLGCTLPRGICYEANIRRENGRWYICLKLWKPPEPKTGAGPPGPAASTPASTPWAPTPTVRSTRTPGPATRWRRD